MGGPIIYCTTRKVHIMFDALKIIILVIKAPPVLMPPPEHLPATFTLQWEMIDMIVAKKEFKIHWLLQVQLFSALSHFCSYKQILLHTESEETANGSKLAITRKGSYISKIQIDIRKRY